MFWERFENLCSLENIKPNPLGKQLGISSGIITSWKNGSIPTGNNLIKLSTHFNCSIDYLLGLDTVPNRQDISSDKDREHLLNCYEKLNERNKGKLIGYADNLLDEQNEQVAARKGA